MQLKKLPPRGGEKRTFFLQVAANGTSFFSKISKTLLFKDLKK